MWNHLQKNSTYLIAIIKHHTPTPCPTPHPIYFFTHYLSNGYSTISNVFVWTPVTSGILSNWCSVENKWSQYLWDTLVVLDYSLTFYKFQTSKNDKKIILKFFVLSCTPALKQCHFFLPYKREITPLKHK